MSTAKNKKVELFLSTVDNVGMRTHKAVPVSMADDLLADVDERAASLGLSRSAYIQQLIRADIGEAALAFPPVSRTPKAHPSAKRGKK